MIAAVAAGAAGLAGVPDLASAEDGFPRIGYSDSYQAPTDRQFIRQWEANPPKGYATLAAANVAATKVAIRRYDMVVRGGGWPLLPAKTLQSGMSSNDVLTLRRRLMLSGDLRGGNLTSPNYDFTLEQAVKRFQAANGLTPTGSVERRTLAALNVPAKARLQQLKRGLTQLQRLSRSVAKKSRYVVVNIPAAQVEAVEDGKIVSRHTGVVGKKDRQTPILQSSIHELNFNPIWRLPPTVIKEDLIPTGRRMQKQGKSVLAKFGIDAYDGQGKKVKPGSINWSSGQPHGLSYRQKSGKDNPMGFLKINFHNGHSVYMHDTPSDTMFGRNFRAASSGCIRVQNIEQLAAWILEPQGITRAQVDRLKETRERKDVSVKKPVPLYFTYITAWATPDGVIQFRRDLYQKDGVAISASAY